MESFPGDYRHPVVDDCRTGVLNGRDVPTRRSER